MQFSLFCHPDDLCTALDFADLRKRGLSRLIISVLYHDWVSAAPRSKLQPIRRELGGMSAVPLRSEYPRFLSPERRASAVPLAEAARAAGLAIDAWSVTLHRDDLARRATLKQMPFLPTDAFGSREACWVCPSTEEAANFLEAHISDIQAAKCFGRVAVEGCHYPPLQHGGAHERDLSRIDAALRQLLEICFCDGCVAHMQQAGLDCEHLREDTKHAVLRHSPLKVVDLHLDAIADLRRQRVTELYALMRQAAPKLGLICIDQPAIAGATFRTGLRTDADTERTHRAAGIDLADLQQNGAGVMCLAYFQSVADVVAQVSACLKKGVPARSLVVALRPGFPDCGTASNLSDKVEKVRNLGVREVAFYELTQFNEEDWQRMSSVMEKSAA